MMITIPKKILNKAREKHRIGVKKVFEAKCGILQICLNYYDLKTAIDKKKFAEEILLFSCDESIKILSINWFLKASKKESKDEKQELYKIKTITNPDKFFNEDNRRFDLKQIPLVQELKNEISYLRTKIDQILFSKPHDLFNFSEMYKSRPQPNSNLKKVIAELVAFLFDYETFSKKESIYTPVWGAYELTNALEVRTCLYCNRNYIQTVSYDKTKVVRPELDHFLPKSKHPVLSLSFYNLIPSCHTCNSNLKGKQDFNLDDYVHPYLFHYDKQKIRFIYKPKSPAGFFGDRSGLNVKLDLSRVTYLDRQIKNSIDLFKINDIYNEHLDIVDSLIQLQRNSNKNRLSDIFSSILIDKHNNPIFKNEAEIYELFIRNRINEKDFHKKVMAKFERDIALEIGLINPIP